MPNPFPTGNGEREGLDARQESGDPLPLRPVRAERNEAENGVPCDHTDGRADAPTNPCFDPYERAFRR